MNSLSQWIDKSMREHWMLRRLSSPHSAFSGGYAQHACGPLPSSPTTSRSLRLGCSVCQATSDRPWPAGSSRVGGVVLIGSGTLRPLPAHTGRKTIRFGVVHDQPPADDRRRCDVAYSGSSLDCGEQMWGTRRRLLLGAGDGTVREILAL